MTVSPNASPAATAALEERARQQLSEGELAPALASHRALVAAMPEAADHWYNLGYLERAARNYAGAVAAYDKAITLGISQPEAVYLNRALVKSENLIQLDAAEADLRAAVAINPQFVAAWLNLGNLAEDRGDTQAAMAAYESALTIDPLNGRALVRLAEIAVFNKQAEAILPRLLDALAHPDLRLSDSIEVRFGIGQLLDSLGWYDEAFQAVSLANHVYRAGDAPRFDADAEARFIDSVISVFPIAASAPPPADVRAPVFICGLFRSGSTMVEQMLGQHSGVTRGGELDYIPWLVHNRLQPWPERASSLTPEELAAFQADYIAALGDLQAGSGLVTDKRPDNFLHIGLIKAMFPDARIIHTVRRPIDNFLSIWFLHFGSGVRYGSDFDDMLAHYRQYRRLMAHWQQHFADDILEVNYDRLVVDPEPEMRRVLDFLGLEWQEDCLHPDKIAGLVRTASVWQVRQPLHTRSSGRWQNYADHIGDLAALLDRAAAEE